MPVLISCCMYVLVSMCLCVCVCVNINLLGPGLLLILGRNLVLQVILVVQNTALPFGHRFLLTYPDLISHLSWDKQINNTTKDNSSNNLPD